MTEQDDVATADQPMGMRVRDALNQIPARPGAGTMVQTFAHQVDYARKMSEGREAIPAHLRNNAGACLAVVDIATRFDFSPFMVANKTYIQKDRLCFESQLVHAMIERSGLLKQRLRCSWSGEGETRRCHIVAHFVGEAEPFTYDTEPVKNLHPGHVEKNGVRYVAGSQLWDDKPDVQLFYNGTYDLVRMYAPDVLMAFGIPAAEPYKDPLAFGDDARDAGPIHERLATTATAGGEGAHPGQMADEIDRIVTGATGQGGAVDAGTETGSQDAPGNAQRTGEAGAKGAGRKSRSKEPKAADAPKETAKEPEPEPKQVVLPPKPKKIKDWDAYARAHIEAAQSSAELEAWWTSDRKLRNDLGVTKDERQPVEAIKIDRVIALKEAGK